ncbi:S1 family peptidase [Caballeronia sp. 15711]|uniref:S1 family peptidase n=1 Tax=Caballeronia sp. 15711 TaxID=3391029 RepID=UPI0039E4A28F
MERAEARVGSAPKEFFQVRGKDGTTVDPSSVIFPILRNPPNELVRVVGTGFYIGHHGLFVTARHVLEECLDAENNPTIALTIVHRIPAKQRVVFRPIIRAFMHNRADIAIGMGGPMRHDDTGEDLWANSVVLSSRPVNAGDSVTTYAYPNSTTALGEGGRQNVHLYPLFYRGNVVECFPGGRDRVMMPGPCFQTSMHLHGGASGGPVFEPDTGRVCGINSTSFSDATDVSFVSMIGGLLDIDVDGVVLNTGEKEQSVALSRLAALGLIPLE